MVKALSDSNSTIQHYMDGGYSYEETRLVLATIWVECTEMQNNDACDYLATQLEIIDILKEQVGE